ncbi:hypothetical protein AWB67_02250 [Caballeronia terrestris]|uniref:Uncharacterized protein n=1 Tax=Caballeronia terrestris TaxID=1226301 RepID=A0A158HYY5_9BURK|nr:hypothetical protein AWB67_02250 [Caballeronia terrestris]
MITIPIYNNDLFIERHFLIVCDDAAFPARGIVMNQ